MSAVVASKENLSDLLARQKELSEQIERAQREERTTAISTIRKLMADNNLTLDDIKDMPRASKGGGTGSVPPKYRHPSTGETWTGRGLQPKWVKAFIGEGNSLEDAKIKE